MVQPGLQGMKLSGLFFSVGKKSIQSHNVFENLDYGGVVCAERTDLHYYKPDSSYF